MNYVFFVMNNIFFDIFSHNLLYILFLHICFLYLSAGNFFLICCYLREIILDFIIFGKDNYR